MRKILISVLALFAVLYCDAQNWELKLNAGANTTFINNIHGDFSFSRTGDPFSLDPEDRPFISTYSTDETETDIKLGFYADAELFRHLRNDWALSLSLGVSKSNFTYDIMFSGSSDTTSAKQIDDEFGDTKLLYISSRFLNVTKSFSNLSVSAGPVLNFLIHDNGEGKTVYRNNEDNSVDAFHVSLHKPAKIIYGGNLALGYKLAEPLEVRLGAQYFFNSVYKKGEETYFGETNDNRKANPLYLSLGLSYSLFKF